MPEYTRKSTHVNLLDLSYFVGFITHRSAVRFCPSPPVIRKPADSSAGFSVYALENALVYRSSSGTNIYFIVIGTGWTLCFLLFSNTKQAKKMPNPRQYPRYKRRNFTRIKPLRLFAGGGMNHPCFPQCSAAGGNTDSVTCLEQCRLLGGACLWAVVGVFQPIHQFTGAHRVGKEIALDIVDAFLLEKVDLFFCLDPFGNDAYVEA